MPFLMYNGTKVLWVKDDGALEETFPATSGHFAYQTPNQQCRKNDGPIPEGAYQMQLFENKVIPNYNTIGDVCNLYSGRGIQQIPAEDPKKPTIEGGSCQDLWGFNRIKLTAFDAKAKNACSGNRSGFYIHDSSKGQTSGCIEIDQKFFVKLRNHMGTKGSQKSMFLIVNYGKGTTTQGNTARP